MEIAARVAAATPLHGIHADRNCSVLGGRHGFWRVRETTLALSTLARAALEFSTDLGDTTSRLQLRPRTGVDIYYDDGFDTMNDVMMMVMMVRSEGGWRLWG